MLFFSYTVLFQLLLCPELSVALPLTPAEVAAGALQQDVLAESVLAPAVWLLTSAGEPLLHIVP